MTVHLLDCLLMLLPLRGVGLKCYLCCVRHSIDTQRLNRNTNKLKILQQITSEIVVVGIVFRL